MLPTLHQRTKYARRRLTARGISGAMRLAQALPDDPAFALARVAGSAAAAARPQRQRVLDNLTRAFGDQRSPDEIDALARAFYRHACLTFFELFRLGRWSPEQVRAVTHVEGREYLDGALAGGRGVIILSGHLGNWEIGVAAVSTHGYPGAGVGQRQRRHSALQDYLATVRTRYGRVIFPDAPRDCFTCLRENRPLLMVVDQWVREGGIPVPFFGHPALSAPGPAQLARMTGAPVVLATARRLPDPTCPGRYLHEVTVEPPIPLVDTGDREWDIWENTARFQARLEAAIRRCPEQWLWNHRRWGQGQVEVTPRWQPAAA